MVLLYITIVLAVIAILFLIIGKLTKKKIIKNISIAIFIFIVVFWLGFYAWALVDMNEEYNRHFPSENTVTNAFIEETNLTNTTAQDIQTSGFSHGRISSIEDNIIYIYDKDNQKYFSKRSDDMTYIDGRTGENYSFSDLKPGYYIDDEGTIFKDITGGELKKELLVSLSLSDDVNIMRTSVTEIKDVKQLGNNEAIVTFEISDLVSSEDYPDVNDSEHTFDVKLKVTNNTKYNTNFYGISTYNAATIENAKQDAMLYLRLNPDTLNDEYPEISEFDSYSN